MRTKPTKEEAMLSLARHIAASAIAWQLGIKFDTAMRDYVKINEKIGSDWLEIAERAARIMTKQTGRKGETAFHIHGKADFESFRRG